MAPASGYRKLVKVTTMAGGSVTHRCKDGIYHLRCLQLCTSSSTMQTNSRRRIPRQISAQEQKGQWFGFLLATLECLFTLAAYLIQAMVHQLRSRWTRFWCMILRQTHGSP